jgi:uncharacterized protein YfaT (DUF1175 family)
MVGLGKQIRWVHQSNQSKKTWNSSLYQTPLVEGTTQMIVLTRQSTSNKNKVTTFRHCLSLIQQTITLIQDTNRVLKENQINKKYKYLGVMKGIND